MKMSDSVAYALGYKDGLNRAIRIFNIIDRKHPEYKMPMELTCRLMRAQGEADDYIDEHKCHVIGKE